jgi:hypothetical protein
MPLRCSYHSASVLDGRVYIVASQNHDVLRFDLTSGVWTIIAPALNIRHRGASFVVCGNLYVAGGFDNVVVGANSSVASNTWTFVADMLRPRMGPGLGCSHHRVYRWSS